MLALIDYDLVAYSCGFAHSSIYYVVEDGAKFAGLRDARSYCDQIGLDYSKTVKGVVAKDPLDHALQSTKMLVNSIIRESQGTEYVGYFSNPASWREGVDPTYKAHRDRVKPVHFQEIVEYLLEHRGGEYAPEGLEADDMLGIRQCQEEETIICTKDKDLDMIPGWHYNWKQKKRYWVDEDEGLRHFYRQCLTGDPVDNIPGLAGVGPKTALRMVPETMDPMEAHCRVGFEYALRFDNPEEVLDATGKLLWIRRDYDDEWSISNS